MRVLAIVFILFAIVLPISRPANGQNIDVWADSAITAPAEGGAISVRCYSNVDIYAITIPIRIESDAIIIDSVHFPAIISRTLFAVNSRLSETNRRGIVSIAPTLALAPLVLRGDEIFRIHYHVRPSAVFEVIDVDTFYNTFYDAGYWITEQIQLADADGNNMYPYFTRGAITVDNSTAVDEISGPLPTEFALEQNYPNPFNPSTIISFATARKEQISLEVFNILGQKVATLVDETLEAGRYEVRWESDSQASGLYFYRLTTPSGTILRKMTLLK